VTGAAAHRARSATGTSIPRRTGTAIERT
jgi:hypothetical protein